jgi:hypothetical protein
MNDPPAAGGTPAAQHDASNALPGATSAARTGLRQLNERGASTANRA